MDRILAFRQGKGNSRNYDKEAGFKKSVNEGKNGNQNHMWSNVIRKPGYRLKSCPKSNRHRFSGLAF
jgi:hypothetical protein